MKKRNLRALTAGLTGLAAGIGILLGGLFDVADDLLPDEEKHLQHTAGSSTVLRQSATSQITRIPLRAELSRMDRLRQWIWNLPLFVRAAVLLPCWAVGRGAVALVGLLFKMLSPVLTLVLQLALQTLLLFLLFALLYKLLFPNGKLRNLFKNGRWLFLLGGALVLTGLDHVLKIFLEDWRWIRLLLGAAVALTVIACLYKLLFYKHPAPELPEKWIEIPYVA